jgi:hypothetical protein
MKTLMDRVLQIFIILVGLILLLVGLFGCNPVKAVLASPEKTAQVVVEYVKRNPVRNDTLLIPGDTVTLVQVTRDSVRLPYPVNHRYTETKVIERTITDTIRILDRSLLAPLEKRLEKLEDELTHWKHTAQVRLYWLLALIAGIVGIGLLKLIQVFKLP